MLNKKAFAAAVATQPAYIEDVFSTWLYTGNGSTQTINNGIDLSTKGGLVWTKERGTTGTSYHSFFDTERGTGKAVYSNTTGSTDTKTDTLTAFTSSGFSLGADAAATTVNVNNANYASWTFAEQAKFFDVVTYTGNGSNRTIAHNLGSVPGCIFIKRTDTTADWQVYHRSLANTEYLVLNSNAAVATGATRWNSTTPTASVFNLGTDTTVNASGGTYVAYIFAHNASGFGLSGTENVISCGSFTTDGSGNATVNLGYEPQWVMYKRSSFTSDWKIVDVMRGYIDKNNVGGSNGLASVLFPNFSSAELTDSGTAGWPTATGFGIGQESISSTFIYIAIRRGPMRVPTSGTSVFGISARSGTGVDATVTGGTIADDLVIIKNRGSAQLPLFASRLTGTGYLDSSSNAAEVAAGTTILQANPWDVMDGVKVGSTSAITNASSNTFVNYLVSRAPGFFDVVCYTGTGANRTVSHNLGVAPELIICKRRSATSNWFVWQVTDSKYLYLESTVGNQSGDSVIWGSVTSTGFGLTTYGNNSNGETYVAYLFASCPGVSKVGTYTGTGTTLAINCGFTGGARFVLIKATSTTGDWLVWDVARGLVAGNDPYLALNSTAAEVTTTDWVDPQSAGFELSNASGNLANTNGVSYIFFAVA